MTDWEEMKAAGGEDLLRLLKNYGRDKPLLRVKTGKKGNVVRLYLKRERERHLPVCEIHLCCQVRLHFWNTGL